MSVPILLILGAGPNVGVAVAKAFAAKSYKVVLTSRSGASKGFDEAALTVKVDLSKPESVPGVFEEVTKELGAAPSVVVYNAADFHFDSPQDPLSTFDIGAFNQSQNINTTSALVALQQAVAGFRSLPASASKTFIYTGNSLNVKSLAPALTFTVGKSGTASAIRTLADTKAYAADGIKFYYGDERTAEGNSAGRAIDGPAHGETYLKLAELKDQGPWQYTFVKGHGYKAF